MFVEMIKEAFFYSFLFCVQIYILAGDKQTILCKESHNSFKEVMI